MRQSFAFAVASLALLPPVSASANAAELVIEQRVAQQFIVDGLFNDGGKWYLLRGNCYAYLEYPKVSVVDGRVVLDAHLSSRVGVDVGGSCVGPGFASNVTISGRPTGSRTKVSLDDIRIDHIDDAVTRASAELVQRVSSNALPKAFEIDLQPLLDTGLAQVKGVKLSVEALTIQEVHAQPGRMSATFDFRLHAQ
jgi:hypothetical protein